jgi:hypothetical protein
VEEAEPEPEAEAEEEAEPEQTDTDGTIAIGETATNSSDVSFTVTKVKCGLDSVGESFLAEEAKGQFCEIKYTVENGGDDQVSLYASDITGQIASAAYEADSVLSQFDGDYFSTDVNPGLAADAVIYIDIPKGKALETITYDPAFSFFTGPVVVSVN